MTRGSEAMMLGSTDASRAAVRVEFTVPSEPGGTREAVQRVAAAVADLALPPERRASLELAVGEAVMNAMEHGNGYAPDTPVRVEVTADPDRLQVAVTDRGGGTGYLDSAERPDIHAKLRGEQSPRGWGLFLIRSLMDRVYESGDDHHHTLTLELHLAGQLLAPEPASGGPELVDPERPPSPRGGREVARDAGSTPS